MSHNERCKECKIRIRELLEKIYGTVIMNYRIPIGTKPKDFLEHPRYPILNEIYASLQKHRGFTEFVRASYVDVDFFLPQQKMIVEFDESQHFSELRKIALSHYPSNLNIGFSRESWMKHCDEIHAYDNDPPFRDEQRAWYDSIRDFIPEVKGFLPTVRLYAKEMSWCSLDPEKSKDVDTFRKLLTDNTRLNSNFVATVILASHLKKPEWGLKQERDPALNNMRMSEMKQIIGSIVTKTTGDGVVLFPGGWFHSGSEPAQTLYQWIRDEIVSEIKDNNRKIIVSLGIDGSFDRPVEADPYDRDQIALAIDKSGIIAMGRKFFPGQDEGRYITIAKGYLEKEGGLSRIFHLNGIRYFLFECNDIKAPYHDVEKYKNPGADIGLNLIHRINEKGQPLSQENNFTCIFGARTSYQWNIPVFLSVIFFRNTVPEDWPSGLYCPRATPYRIGYDEIRLTHSFTEQIPLTEGYADIRVFWDIRTSIQRLKNRVTMTKRDIDQLCTKTEVSAVPLCKRYKIQKSSSLDIPVGKYRPRFESIIQIYHPSIPHDFRMTFTTSKTNCVIKAHDLPNGLHYYFNDWNTKISVELGLDRSKLPQWEPAIRALSEKKYENLPLPVLKVQGNWLMLQFFFEEDVPQPDIASAMNRLIEQTYSDLKLAK